ncbi:MAG: hypothetical protein E7033_05545 [Akkermansiaceae bacterium]|nr:hypothetical protein [Akkermansiaceae bacterium]
MKFRHTLMLSAVVAAPLMTETAPARTLVQLYKDLAATPQDVASDAATRSDSFPALAVMPKELEACLALRDINGKIETIPFLSIGAGKGLDQPKIAPHVQAFGLGIGKGNAQALKDFMPIYQYLTDRESMPRMADEWTESARAAYSGIIGEQVSVAANNQALTAYRSIGKMKLHPVYVAVTADVPAHRFLMDAAEDYIAHYEKLGGSRVESNGFKGVKIPFSALFDKPAGTGTVESGVREQIDARNLHLMFKRVGGALVCAVCEDPAEIAVAESADASVLSAKTMTFCDSYLLKEISHAAYISPELLNSFNSYSNYDLRTFATFVEKVFRAMGQEDADNVAAFNNACRGVDALADFAASFIRTDADQPITFFQWPDDDGMHVKFTLDSYGASYKPGQIRLARIGVNSKVMFYTEATPEVMPGEKQIVDVLEPALNVAAGYITSLEQSQAQATGATALLAYMPRVKSFMRSLKAANAALGDAPALVAMPLKDGNVAISYFNSVTDRAALGKAGDELVVAMGRMVDGKKDTISKTVKTKKTKTGVSHTANLSALIPMLDQVNVTISDKASTFALGNSAAFNAQMIKHGVGKINFTGAVYTVRPGAVAVAAAAAPEAAMLTGVLQGAPAVHATNTIADDVRTLHILITAPGADDVEE